MWGFVMDVFGEVRMKKTAFQFFVQMFVTGSGSSCRFIILGVDPGPGNPELRLLDRDEMRDYRSAVARCN